MKVSLRKLLAKRGTSKSANAGFWAGLAAGVITAVFALLTALLAKETLLEQFAMLKEQYGALIPDIDTLYLLNVVITPPVIVLIHAVVGILFGLFFDRLQSKTPLKALLLSLLLGLIFGVITDLPVSRLAIMVVSLFTWLLFAFVFIRRIAWKNSLR